VARITQREVIVEGCPKGAFFEAINRLYDGSLGEASLRLEDALRVAEENLLGEDGNQTPIITLVDELIAKAFRSGATDIHIQPQENVVYVRFRIDGVMCSGEVIPKDLQGAVESRIKIMANLDISEKRLPQDGRIQTTVDSRRIDLRVSTMPNIDGEAIVLRLLDREKAVVTLDQLGFTIDHKQIFRNAVDKPNGIVLVTGPTGSGKTTTLYAGLMEVNAQEKNVTTLEDPVEYRVPVIRQSQVNNKAGFGFSEGLRALLRQDPDVILVGEMRDGETADLAIRAAMTGHMVLSTLHTNDASSALPRLVEMGISPYLLPSTIVAIVSQRLVRKPCNHCKERYTPSQHDFLEFGHDPMEGDFVKAVGCDRCSGSGYHGRIPIAEILCMSPKVSELIMQGAASSAIHHAAVADGMVEIRQDGFEKARQGLTTLSEVQRVAERRLMMTRAESPTHEATSKEWATRPG
jgi:type IV pilus assembly protein PilB